MKTFLTPIARVCFLLLLLLGLAAAEAPTARADRAPPPPAPAAEPQPSTEAVADQLGMDASNEAACIGKAPLILCDTAKGEPGICKGVKVASGAVALLCVATRNQAPHEQGAMVMLLFGIIVAIIGGFIWWRLNKNWHKT